MKNKPLALSLLVLAILACGVPTLDATGAMKPLATSEPTVTTTPLPTPTQLVMRPETLVVTNGCWNLRQGASKDGPSLGLVCNGTHLVVIISTDAKWALVQTVEDDPLDVLTGSVNLGCCQ